MFLNYLNRVNKDIQFTTEICPGCHIFPTSFESYYIRPNIVLELDQIPCTIVVY